MKKEFQADGRKNEQIIRDKKKIPCEGETTKQCRTAKNVSENQCKKVCLNQSVFHCKTLEIPPVGSGDRLSRLGGILWWAQGEKI